MFAMKCLIFEDTQCTGLRHGVIWALPGAWTPSHCGRLPQLRTGDLSPDLVQIG